METTPNISFFISFNEKNYFLLLLIFRPKTCEWANFTVNKWKHVTKNEEFLGFFSKFLHFVYNLLVRIQCSKNRDFLYEQKAAKNKQKSLVKKAAEQKRVWIGIPTRMTYLLLNGNLYTCLSWPIFVVACKLQSTIVLIWKTFVFGFFVCPHTGTLYYYTRIYHCKKALIYIRAQFLLEIYMCDFYLWKRHALELFT